MWSVGRLSIDFFFFFSSTQKKKRSLTHVFFDGQI